MSTQWRTWALREKRAGYLSDAFPVTVFLRSPPARGRGTGPRRPRTFLHQVSFGGGRLYCPVRGRAGSKWPALGGEQRLPPSAGDLDRRRRDRGGQMLPLLYLHGLSWGTSRPPWASSRAHDRGACRWPQGTHRPGGRLPGVRPMPRGVERPGRYGEWELFSPSRGRGLTRAYRISILSTIVGID